MEKLLSIGKILNFHGILGEVKVGYTEGMEHFFTGSDKIHAAIGTKTVLLTPEKVRFHKKFALIKFKEFNSIDEMMEFKGAYLKVPKSNMQPLLKKDEFYIDDLVGLTAYDTDGILLGKVSGVSSNKGQDVLFIKDSENREHIIPFARDLVPDVDLKEKRLTIKNIEGLIQ